MTNKQLYESYCDSTITQALRDCRLKTLRERASYGNSDAKFYVRLIESKK